MKFHSFLIVFILCSPLAAQNFYWKNYASTNGLDAEQIFYSFSSPQGFQILSTQKGNVLFDGYRFIHLFDKPDRINSFHYKAPNFYYENGKGLVKQDFTKLSSESKLLTSKIYTDSNPNNDHFKNIFVDNKDRVWCTDYEYIKFFKNGKWTEFLLFPGNKSLHFKVEFIQISSYELLISTPKGLFKWREGSGTLEEISLQFLEGKIVSTSQKLDNTTILFGTTSGEYYQYDYVSKIVVNSGKLSSGEKIIGAVKEKNGFLLYTSSTLYKWTKSGLTVFFEVGDGVINHVYYNPNTELYFISTEKGLIKLAIPNLGISVFNLPNANSRDIVHSIAEVGSEVFASSGSQIWVRKNFQYQLDYKFSHSTIKSINSINGELIVVTTQGLYKRNKLGDYIKLPLPNLLESDDIKKVILTPTNELWVLYSNHPILRYNYTTNKLIDLEFNQHRDFWTTNQWNDITVDNKGKIWMVGWMPKGFGITLYNPINNLFEDISDKKFSNDKNLFVGDYYNRISVAYNGNLLASAYGGFNIISHNNSRLLKRVDVVDYTVDDTYFVGLNSVNTNDVLFGTGNGLYLYQNKLNSVVKIDKSDGLPSNVVTNAFTKLASGTILLGFEGKIAEVNSTKLLKGTLGKKIEISQLHINGKARFYEGGSIILNKDETNLIVNFSNTTYLEPNKIFFQYSVDNEPWIDLGNESSLSFSHLSPGSYKVRVRAKDQFGNIQKEELKFLLVAKPPFLKSPLFYALLFLFSLGLIYAVIRYTVYTKTKEEKYKRSLKETEMKLLRTQMNPHFIFNTLNSINSYILQNKTENASSYLTSFSKLMRRILDHSQKNRITLEEELESLKIYLELESARLEGSFDYQIVNKGAVETDEVFLPPLVIQPYVENAIWHGLHQLDKKGTLLISYEYCESGTILITIEDNGIGREKSFEINKNKRKDPNNNKSYGIAITKDRLRFQDPENTVEIEDLYDENKQSLGTRVLIKLSTNTHD